MANLGDWAYWLLGLGVLATMAGLVYVAWWALFGDRAKGRRRCPQCWYNMAYAPPPGMRCSECGFSGTREAQFHKTRRRYSVAVAAILASILIAVLINERVTQRGYLSLLPARVLILMMPLSESPQRGAFAELIRRNAAGEISQANWGRILARCAAGDWRARPTDEAWMQKYGQFLWSVRRAPSAFVTSDQILRPLLDIPPRIDVTSREIWPVDVPVTVNVQVLDWWPWAMECRLRAVPRVEGAEPITFIRSFEETWRRTPFALNLPAIHNLPSEITIDFEVDRRRVHVDWRNMPETEPDEATAGEWERVGTFSVTVPVRREGALDHLMQPTSSEDMEDAIRQVLRNGAVKWEAGRSPVRFSIAHQATFSSLFNDTAIGVSVELRRGDQVARRLNLWWLGGALLAANRLADRQYGFEIDFEDYDLLQQLNTDDDRWHMRVRSDPRLALRVGDAAKYWHGDVTIPLRLLERAGEAPARPWRMEN